MIIRNLTGYFDRSYLFITIGFLCLLFFCVALHTACRPQQNENQMVYGSYLCKVSTNTQDYERQLDELRIYAGRMGYEVVKEFSEKINGAKIVEEHAALTDLLNHEVSKVIIYECYRLSRRAMDFLSINEHLTETRVSVYIHQNGLETLQPDGKPNPIVQLVLGMLAQFNGLERGQ